MSPCQHPESVLLAAADFVSAKVSDSFVADLVAHAARTLGLDHVHIACLDASGERIEVRAAWHDGEPVDAWTYDIADSAGGAVLRQGRHQIESGARTAHPRDRDLQRLAAEGYIGAAIPGTHGRAAGLIAGISHAPLIRSDPALSALRILAAHAGNVFAVSAAHERLRQKQETLRHTLDRAERQIRESELHFRLLADSGQALVWTNGTDKGCDYVNKVWLDFTGRTLEQEYGDGWAESIHPDDRQRCMDIYLTAFDRRERFSMQYRLRRHDGEYRWIQDDGCPRYDEHGAFIGYIGHCLDITAARQSQEALVRKERYQQALLDNFPFAVWLKDTERRFLAVNQAFADAVGATSTDALIGRTEDETVIWPTGTSDQPISDREVMDRRHKLHAEHEILGSNGPAWMEIYKAPVADANGDLLGTVGFARDISDRKQAEQAVVKQRERMRLILDNAPVGIWLQRPSGRMEFVNRTFCEAIGIPEETFLARAHYSELIPKEFIKQCQESDARAMAEPGTVVTHERQRFADGEIHDLRVFKIAKRDEQGEPEALVGICLDITDELRNEQALRKSEAKFHTMLDWSHDWEYWILPDGHFCYMTPSAERLTGYPVEAFEKDPGLLDAIIHPEDRAAWDRHIQQALATTADTQICELEFRVQRKGGGYFWATHRCRPVRDAAGNDHGRRVTVRDISARKEAEEQIRNLAYFDFLTGLPNRRLLLDRLGHALIASRRSRHYGALLMIDLDHFKTLNDTQGHDEGDRLLVEVAHRIRQTLRAEDTASRLGGDEYVLLLEGLGKEEESAANRAEEIAEKIRHRLNAPYTISGDDQTYYCSCSIGLTLFSGEEGHTVEVLLKQADVALYQAKDAGRNTTRFFSPAMQMAIESRMALEAALRQALPRDELRLHYQPQFDQNGRCIGAEALLRWQRPDLGLISPIQFIPLAEETGLILPIGRWVVDTAGAQLKAWEAQPATRSLQLAINVSARQFHQPDFVAQVRDSLERSGANPARLKLELTESVVLENADLVIERMQELRALGVGFSMDDFGTGYSSLSYLKRLPLDQLKIDKSFVRDITTDPNDAAIVRAILAMSHSLGLQVLAEGVETEEQQIFLRENGCDAFQGYLFGRPIPIGKWPLDPNQSAFVQTIASEDRLRSASGVVSRP
ncbi:EAL domain-containing protein [Thiorhodococcus fuscus]|uniref:EAL domain-containing protein n=1 Tax=Thiorhodococcus fuscus TaxID=527200 RepID=A0ABW4YDS8_9GAMM